MFLWTKIISEFFLIKQSIFARNIIKVASGNALSYVIPFVLSPIIARLFPPTSFGEVALYSTTAAFVTGIGTLKYESAIQLPKEEKDAVNLLGLSFIILTTISLISLVSILVFNSSLIRTLGIESISKWFYFIPLSIFVGGTYAILNVWTSRSKKFGRMAIYNIANTAITSTVKIVLGLANYSIGGLIAGTLIGQFISKGLYVLNVYKKDNIDLSLINTVDLKRVAIKYKDFPIFLNSQQLLGRIKETGIIYLITIYYSTEILGLYSLTIGALSIPIYTIGTAVSNVYFQKASEMVKNNQDLWALTKKMIVRQFILGIMLFMPVLLFGPKIYSIFYGEQWFLAGFYAQFIVFWFIMIFIETGVNKIAIVCKKQKQNFYLNALFTPIFILLTVVILEMDWEFSSFLKFVVVYNMIHIFVKLFYWRKWALLIHQIVI